MERGLPVQLPPYLRGEASEVCARTLPWHITDIRLDEYWEATGGGEGILVGVIDTGIDEQHPHIAGRIDHAVAFVDSRHRGKPPYYDGSDHGTHVATTIALMAPKARFGIYKVLADNGSGWNSDVAGGIRRAVDDGCQILNISLGGPQDDPATREACFYAKSRGVQLFIASGNEGAGSVGYPSHHGVAVGAINRANQLADFSNRGVHLDCCGYGVNIRAGVPGGGEQIMSGTSMATPWVVGIAACRLSLEKKVHGRIVTRSDSDLMKLSTFTHDLGPKGRDTGYGHGKPDVAKLFDLKAEEPGAPVVDEPTPSDWQTVTEFTDDSGDLIRILKRAATALLLMVILGLGFQSTCRAENTLHYLNAQRAYFGLHPLQPDPHLQQRAEWAARQRSLRGMNGHLWGGKPVAGRWEGTARRNSRQRGPAGEPWGPEDVYACYQNHRQARYAGCASVLGRDGYWYYQINLR